MNYTWGIDLHGQKQGGAILPDMMRWLWRDHPVSTDPKRTPSSGPSARRPSSRAAKQAIIGPACARFWSPDYSSGTAVLGLAQQPAKPATPAPRRPAILTDASADGFERTVKPFLAEHCVSCHGNQKHKKDLNFETPTSVKTLIDDRDRWDEVVLKLRNREMPPDDEPQPAEHQRQAVAGWLERELARIDKATPPDPGRVTARRLNRAEYNNTVKDLLGAHLRPADDFPQDDSGYGFDNIADVLSLSPALMEKYMTAADRVAREALFGPPAMQPTLIRLRSDGRRNGEARSVPRAGHRTGLSLSNAFHAVHRVRVEGDIPDQGRPRWRPAARLRSDHALAVDRR